jgi:hypothetical protein
VTGFEPCAGSPDDGGFNRTSGTVNVSADDDIVAECEQVVVAEREAIHVHAAADARVVQREVRGPHWRAAY